MAQAVFAFLMSILISLGGSVAADNIGQDFATIYNNQDASVKAKMDQYLFDPGGQLIRDISLEGTKLTAEMLYKIQGGKVSTDIIQESIGIDAWKDFVNSSQNNVAGFGKTISTTDGYKLRFYVDHHPNYNPDTGKFDYYVVWYDVTDPDGNVVKRDYDVTSSIYGFKDETDAATALGNSYIDKDGKFHFLSYNGKELAVVDCANLFPAGTSGQFTPAAFGDGTIGQITDAAIAGTEIGQLPIAADGSITLPDGTKVYPNSDGTYNIDGVPYSPTYNLAAYDDTALLNLLQTLIDAQANGSAGDTPATNYSGVLGRILSAVNSLRSTFSSTMSSIKSKVSDILSAVKDLPSNISSAISSDLAISDEVKNKAISDLKTKVGYSAIQSNVNIISTTFFGERTFNDKGEVVIAPVFDTGETITTQRPHLYFMLFNKRYDLFSGLYMFDGAVNTFKSVVSAFIICAFVLGVFRSLPSILVSCAEVVGISNPTVITNTFSNFNIYQKVNDNKPPKTVTAKAPKKGG